MLTWIKNCAFSYQLLIALWSRGTRSCRGSFLSTSNWTTLRARWMCARRLSIAACLRRWAGLQETIECRRCLRIVTARLKGLETSALPTKSWIPHQLEPLTLIDQASIKRSYKVRLRRETDGCHPRTWITSTPAWSSVWRTCSRASLKWISTSERRSPWCSRGSTWIHSCRKDSACKWLNGRWTRPW